MSAFAGKAPVKIGTQYRKCFTDARL